MPQVPQRQQQVQNAALPGVRVSAAPSPQMYGAEVGQTLAKVGAALYEEERYQADRTAVFEADRQAAELQTSLEGKLASMRGKNVLGAEDVLKKEWQDGIAKIQEALSNDRQKGHFGEVSSRRAQQLNEMTQRHTTAEYTKYQDEETVSTVHSAADRVRSQPGNPSVWNLESTRALAAIEAQARRQGLTGVVTEAMLRDPQFRASYEAKGEAVPTVGDQYLSETLLKRRADALSSLHANTIQGYLAVNDDIAAKDYFTAHKNDLNAEARNALEATVMEGSSIGKARRTVNQWIDQRKTEDEMVDEARKLAEENPKLGELARSYAVQHFADYKRFEEQHIERAYDTSVKALKQVIAKEPGVYHDPRQVFGLATFLSLKPNTQASLEKIAKDAASGESEHDAVAWFNFRAIPDADLAKMKQDDLLTYLNKFDPKHYDKAIEDWNGARERAAGIKTPKYETLFSNNEMFKNAVERSGFFPLDKPKKDWTDEQKLIWGTMEDKAIKLIGQYPAGTSPDVIQKGLKELVQKEIGQKYVVDPGFFSRNKEVPAAGIEPYIGEARSIRIPLKEIPPDRQDVLRGALRKAGVPITTQNIEELEAKSRLKQQGVTK